jgi:hypothetical protein
MEEPRHFLLVQPFDSTVSSEDQDWYEVEHPDCLLPFESLTYGCAIDYYFGEYFLDVYCHVDDPHFPDNAREPLYPGYYSVKYGFSLITVPHYGSVEAEEWIEIESCPQPPSIVK